MQRIYKHVLNDMQVVRTLYLKLIAIILEIIVGKMGVFSFFAYVFCVISIVESKVYFKETFGGKHVVVFKFESCCFNLL